MRSLVLRIDIFRKIRCLQISERSKYEHVLLLSPIRDIGKVVEALYGDNPPSIMIIGHSMGGAIAVHTAAANHIPSLLGLCVIDVVEGRCLFFVELEQQVFVSSEVLRGANNMKHLQNSIRFLSPANLEF